MSLFGSIKGTAADLGREAKNKVGEMTDADAEKSSEAGKEFVDAAGMCSTESAPSRLGQPFGLQNGNELPAYRSAA